MQSAHSILPLSEDINIVAANFPAPGDVEEDVVYSELSWNCVDKEINFSIRIEMFLFSCHLLVQNSPHNIFTLKIECLYPQNMVLSKLLVHLFSNRGRTNKLQSCMACTPIKRFILEYDCPANTFCSDKILNPKNCFYSPVFE